MFDGLFVFPPPTMDGLDDQEESVRIAVKALGDMRNSASRTRDPSSTSPAFVARMSHIPFVNSALRVYEQGKASSRMVKYGAEMVEASVKTMSMPVINRLPVELDEFACRQLDRLDRYRHPSADENHPPLDPSNNNDQTRSRTKTFDGSALEEEADNGMRPEQASSNSRPSTPTQIEDESRSQSSSDPRIQDETQLSQPSRWQAVLLEAGGLSAALSEENMRRLKYCLQWLQYATAYIDAHILFLRNFTADLQPLPSDSAESTRRPPISEEHMRRLIDVRRDIVHTIRQAVDIVSKYAGGALPEPARTRVRGFILTLPQRWASKAGGTGAGTAGPCERDSTVTAAASGTGTTRRSGGQRRAAYRERGPGSIDAGSKSGASSRAPSPSSSSPRISRSSLNTHLRRSSNAGEGGGGETGRVPAGTALVAAQRILALATESLDMMRNVTGVMKDSLDRAETWVGRLRTVGIQRGTQQGEDDISGFEFPNRSGRANPRRSSSSSQVLDEHDDLVPCSPFFSASSSTAWGSSIPSTPGGGTFTPVYVGNAPSPGAIPIGAMSLSSRYNTPKSSILKLPGEEEEEEEEEEEAEEEDVKRRDRVVVGGGEMDVDVDV